MDLVGILCRLSVYPTQSLHPFRAPSVLLSSRTSPLSPHSYPSLSHPSSLPETHQIKSTLPPLPLYASTPHAFNPPSLDIHLQGLLALLLSLKKKPVIRWEKMSGVAKKLAEELGAAITDQGGVYGDLFGFKGTSGPAPVLVVLGKPDEGSKEEISVLSVAFTPF